MRGYYVNYDVDGDRLGFSPAKGGKQFKLTQQNTQQNTQAYYDIVIPSIGFPVFFLVLPALIVLCVYCCRKEEWDDAVADYFAKLEK